MLLLFSTPSCNRCKIAKNLLEKNNIAYKEVNVAESDENMQIAQSYGVTTGGTIVNPQTRQKIDFSDLEIYKNGNEA